MMISGYLSGYLVMRLHVPFVWALLAGFVAGGIIGYIVSLFIGDAPTFAVVIVGFTSIYITRTIVENMPIIGGTMGMFGLPNIGGSPVMHRWIVIGILYLLVVVCGFLIYRFDHSSIGRAASTVFVDKELASSLGIDIKKLGIVVQTFSCTLAGGVGVLYGFIYKSFHLDFFSFALIGVFMTVLFVGGYSTQWGSLIAAPILYGLPLFFPPEVQSWRIVIYGVMLIFVLVLKPEGFITRKFVYSLGFALSRKRE
jgi:branched-chain amino acid transport system permease protein